VHLHPSNFILHPCPLIPACAGMTDPCELSLGKFIVHLHPSNFKLHPSSFILAR
jgi:hypothetical protein